MSIANDSVRSKGFIEEKKKKIFLYKYNECFPHQSSATYNYEGCSNMNASSFITFFTYMLRQNVIPFWNELCVALKLHQT